MTNDREITAKLLRWEHSTQPARSSKKKKKKKIDRPTSGRERKKKKSVPRNSEWDTLNARWKSDPGLVIKVPPCALIPESGYPFLGGNAATIKLRGPRSSPFVHVRPSSEYEHVRLSRRHRRTRSAYTFSFHYRAIDRVERAQLFQTRPKQSDGISKNRVRLNSISHSVAG